MDMDTPKSIMEFQYLSNNNRLPITKFSCKSVPLNGILSNIGYEPHLLYIILIVSSKMAFCFILLNCCTDQARLVSEYLMF